MKLHSFNKVPESPDIKAALPLPPTQKWGSGFHRKLFSSSCTLPVTGTEEERSTGGVPVPGGDRRQRGEPGGFGGRLYVNNCSRNHQKGAACLTLKPSIADTPQVIPGKTAVRPALRLARPGLLGARTEFGGDDHPRKETLLRRKPEMRQHVWHMLPPFLPRIPSAP